MLKYCGLTFRRAQFCQRIISLRQFHCSKVVTSPAFKLYDPNASTIQKMIRKMPVFGVKRWRMQESSGYLYEACTDAINFENFLTYCKMEDNFMSWFTVTELHVWLVMVRAMEEGADGLFIRDQLAERMWEDIKERLRKLGPITVSKRNELSDEFYQCFNAAMVGYDEGLLTNDKVLAAAVWRIFYCFKCDDPLLIETIVRYIREQHEWLSFIERDVLLLNGKIVWKDFPPLHP